MRRMLFVIATLVVMSGVGCNSHNLVQNRCSQCNGNAHAADHVPRLPPGGGGAGGGMSGPAVGAYAYPYYTTRAPRDFLNPNPPTIGP